MSLARRMALVVAIVIAMTAAVEATSAAAFKRVKGGDTAPGFTLPDLDGNEISLEAYGEGPLTAVCFWAMWSPKSVALLQDLQKLTTEFEPNGFRVLTVNTESAEAPADLEERLKAFLAKNNISVPVVVDRDLEQYSTWGVIATPATAFLGKELVVGYEFSGHPTSAYEDMREQIQKALGIEEAVAEAAKPKRARYKASKRALLHFGLAHTLYERGQFAKADRKLRNVLKEDSEYPDAHALAGAIQLGLIREDRKGAAPTKAREAFDRAVELDATVPMGLAGQAQFALEDGDLPKAVELCRTAVGYTEDEDLPNLPPLEVAGGAPENRPEAPAAVEGEPGKPAEEPAGKEEPEASPAVSVYLDRATELLDGDNADQAKDLLAKVVDGLLAFPETAQTKGGDPLEKMKKMKLGAGSKP